MAALLINDFYNISVRALNYWKTIFPPSYIGLRIFLKQLSEVNFEQYLENYLFRKYRNTSSPKYRKFFQLKEITDLNEYSYREFYAASPTNAIAEAYCLELLSNIPSLFNRENVYSYRWPINKCDGRCFTYFYSGYKERRDNVTELLLYDKSYKVYVYDIKNYYPSVNKGLILNRLFNHIKFFDDDKIKSFIETICKNVMSVSDKGIPIGPALGHVFGNIALENIDDQMSKKIGGRYLRYVDDIFLVLKENELKEIQTILAELVESEGLTLHEKKYDEMSADDWFVSITGDSEEKLADEFSNYLMRIILFLWWKPELFDDLKTAFKDEGIPLPLKRFFIDSQYGRFHRFFHGVFLRKNWDVMDLLNLRNENINKLVYDTKYLREKFISAIAELNKNELPQTGMKKRWFLQRYRFLLNRLLYLTPLLEYQSLKDLAPEDESFNDYHILVQSIIDHKIDDILRMPGIIISTFASIIQEQDDYQLKSYDKNLLEVTGVFESICILSLYGIVAPPTSWLNNLSKRDSELLNFCRHNIPDKRDLDDLSYEDEIRSLQIGINRKQIEDLLNTRFSDQEALNLDGLLMSRYGASY